MTRQSAKQANKPFRLETINARTDDKITKTFEIINHLKEEINTSENKDQINAFINTWTNKHYVAKLTREDSFYGRLSLAFTFPANKKKSYCKIQGKWSNDHKIWIWTMADFGKPANIENEKDMNLATTTIFQILLNKFLKSQKLNNGARELALD